MLLKIGGPYNGYKNGEIIELDDDEGQDLVDMLGGEPRVTVLADLRQPLPPPPDDDDDDAAIADDDTTADPFAEADEDEAELAPFLTEDLADDDDDD